MRVMSKGNPGHCRRCAIGHSHGCFDAVLRIVAAICVWHRNCRGRHGRALGRPLPPFAGGDPFRSNGPAAHNEAPG